MRTFVKENTWLTRGFMDFGWGNGYVVLPKGHPLHGKDYDAIHNELPDLDVNGGLTFADCANSLIASGRWPELTDSDKDGWVIGFDTAHSWDTLDKWPKEEVEKETERLLSQVAEA